MSDYPPPPPSGGDAPPPPPPPPGGFSGGGGYGAGGGQYPPQGGGGFGAPAEKINNYLVPAILATLFCCLPTGIVAIIMAAQVNSKLSQGDVAGARQSAKNAKTWTFVSVGLGLLAILAWFAIFGLAIIAGDTTTETNFDSDGF